MSSVSAISAGGLVLDIGGSLTLASAFMFKRPQHAVREASSPYGGANTVVLVSLAKQTADAWVGGILLAIGFGAQLAQSVGARPKWATLQLAIPVACLILALGLLLLCCVLRPWNVKRAQTQHLIFTLEALHEADLLKSWRQTIIDGAKNLGREIRPGESPARLAISVLGEERWAKLTAGVDVPDDVLNPHASEAEDKPSNSLPVEVVPPQVPEPPAQQSESRDFLLAAAAWQDGLLQSYRSISLTLQSVMLAVGAILVGATFQTTDKVAVPLLFGSLFFVVLFALFALAVMAEIVASRGEDVTWWHDRLFDAEDPDAPRPLQDSFSLFKKSQDGRTSQTPWRTLAGLFWSALKDLVRFFRRRKTDVAQVKPRGKREFFESGIAFTRRRIDNQLLAGLGAAWFVLLGVEFGWLIYVVIRHSPVPAATH